jgi:uroporphyrinogen decarboxylase
LTTRERLLAVFNGQPTDHLPNLEFGYWEETVHVWHTQGLPAGVTSDAGVERYLGLEGISVFLELPVSAYLFPRFERTVLEDAGDRQIIRDEEGNTCEIRPGHSTMPRYLRFGLQTREDWQALKRERLDPLTPGRVGDVAATLREAATAGIPVFFNAGSLYGWLRNWMGLEGLSIALMTEREWVEEMMEHLTGLTLAMIDQLPAGIRIDLAWWWEDMCYNRGPLISPRMFEELLVPRYRRITGRLREHDVTHNVLDCDGRIHQLVPAWLGAGINCMFPLEAAHTDAFRLREEFGDRILLLGGVDKRALIAGRESIDREIERLLPLVRGGRYIPCLDHRVPADVTFPNYLYYLAQKEILLRA